MSLPFSHDAFLDVFAAYNTPWWPVALALWIATLAGAIQLVRGRAHDAGLAALLALHWAWSGVAYHARPFAAIDPAAPLFAALFLVQALAFLWSGVVRRRLAFAWHGSRRHRLAALPHSWSACGSFSRPWQLGSSSGESHPGGREYQCREIRTMRRRS